MKIYTQDRRRVLEIPKEIWITVYRGGCGIFSTSLFPQLGEYETEERASEVLEEIFQYYRNGKNSYIMPLE